MQVVTVDGTYDAVAMIGSIVTGIIQRNSAFGDIGLTSSTTSAFYCVTAVTNIGTSASIGI